MRLLKQATSHQKTRKMEFRYDPEKVRTPCDKGVQKITRSSWVVPQPNILTLKEVNNSSRRIGDQVSLSQSTRSRTRLNRLFQPVVDQPVRKW